MDSANLNNYIKSLIQEMGVSDLDEKVQQKLEISLTQQANTIMNRKLVESLSREHQKELEVLMDSSSSQDEIALFIEKHVEDLPHVVAESLIELRTQYVKG